MKKLSTLSLLVTGLLCISVQSGFAQLCVGHAVPVGTLCVDKYEAIVVPFRPTLFLGSPGSLEGKQFGRTGDDYPCADNGNDCHVSKETRIYAASVPGVTPSRFITWFQAQQACANVGKRLLRNGEWQMAAAGTPDPEKSGFGDCNVDSPDLTPTGSRAKCVSNFGAFDMVGNASEWVEDWMQPNTGNSGEESANSDYGRDGILGMDDALFQGGGAGFPAALVRGGNFLHGSIAGVFALNARFAPSFSDEAIGFRCAYDRR